MATVRQTDKETGVQTGADASAPNQELDEAALALAQGGRASAPSAVTIGAPVAPAAGDNPPRRTNGANFLLGDGSVRF